MRTPAKSTRPRPRRSELASFPAPIGGWIANQNRATPNPTGQGAPTQPGAERLENWFPTATGCRMRAGSQLHATLGDGSLPVTSLFSYVEGTNQKLFGSTGNAIYDITAPLSPENLELVTDTGTFIVDQNGDTLGVQASLPSIAALTGGDWVSVQFATPGGTFLRLVNGKDTPLVYNGTSFGTAPAITVADPTKLSYVWSFKNRLFFIEKESLDAWYLPVDSIGGAATIFPLGGVFQRGGSLLFGASWSLDESSGLSAYCAFFTTEGEVAVYQGTDPGSAATWSLVGVYRIGRPLGAKSWIRAGGDLVISTDVGFVSLSQAAQRDYAALGPAAVSYPIETAWNEAVAERGGDPWHAEVWPTKQSVVIALPSKGGARPEMLVANSRTGAWCLYTGWNGTCLELFGDRLFFGSEKGQVIEAEVGGSDRGIPYTGLLVPLFDDFKSPASLKTAGMARAVFLAPEPPSERISIQADFVVKLPPPPNASSTLSPNLWGTGIWGQSVWGATRESVAQQAWRSVGGSGYALAPAVQITSGSVAPPNIEIVRVEMTFDVADIIS